MSVVVVGVESGELAGPEVPTMTAVAVYLNQSRDSFSGFNRRTARLRKAVEFATDADLAWRDPRVDGQLLSMEELDASFEDRKARQHRFAESVFEQLNIGGEPGFGIEAAEYTKLFRAAGNRSLSVGDVVEIGWHCYAVGRFGWEEVLGVAVRLAARRFELFGADEGTLA